LDYSKENLIFATKSQQTVNSKEIGKTIKARRQALGVTQQTLADLADVGINILVAIERGQGNPKLETLLTVLDTLGLQLDIHL
jgi:y4mF family transcriptional regulator